MSALEWPSFASLYVAGRLERARWPERRTEALPSSDARAYFRASNPVERRGTGQAPSKQVNRLPGAKEHAMHWPLPTSGPQTVPAWMPGSRCIADNVASTVVPCAIAKHPLRALRGVA